MKITSTEDMNKAFNNKNDKYLKWTTMETKEKKVVKAVMVPLIVSHDGAIHRDTVMRWKDFAKDIDVDRVRMGQNVLRYNVVIVGRFFNKGKWTSEAWRRDHPEEFAGEELGRPERMATAEERRGLIGLHLDREGAVCVRPSGTPPPRGVWLTSDKMGNP